MTEIYSGGCQCGAVRFRVTDPSDSAICHCRMCQKAFANYFAPLVTCENVEWTRGEPSMFRSSNRAQRGFCAACGTPLFYRGEGEAYEMAMGAFDDPRAVAPTRQIGEDHKLPAFNDLPNLAHQTDPESEAAFRATVTNYQHPDHDTETWPPKEE